MGDMQHLMLLDCTLADFLDGRLELSGAPPGMEGSEEQQEPRGGERAAASGGEPQGPRRLFAYLAQCPMGVSAADRRSFQPGPLAGLLADVEVPEALQGRGVNQVNFWASPRWVLRLLGSREQAVDARRLAP